MRAIQPGSPHLESQGFFLFTRPPQPEWHQQDLCAQESQVVFLSKSKGENEEIMCGQGHPQTQLDSPVGPARQMCL